MGGLPASILADLVAGRVVEQASAGHRGQHTGHKGAHAGLGKAVEGAPPGQGAKDQNKGNDKDKTPSTPAAAIEAIRNSDVERGVGISADGKLAFQSESESKGFLWISNAQRAALKGGTFVHNHPESSPFSAPDLLMAIGAKVATMQVVSPKYTYTMKVADPKQWEKISNAFMRARAKPGTTSADGHAILEGLAAKMKFTYTRESVPSGK